MSIFLRGYMAGLAESLMGSSSLSNVSQFISEVKQKASVVKRQRVESLTSLNERHGFREEEWLEITSIVIRMLAPFVTALFVIMVFPPLAAKIILPVAVISVIFLSALYGQPDRELTSPTQNFKLVEISPQRFYEERRDD
jgi:hypothetical protein